LLPVTIKEKEKGVQVKYELEDIPSIVRSRNTCLAAFVLTLGFYITLLFVIIFHASPLIDLTEAHAMEGLQEDPITWNIDHAKETGSINNLYIPFTHTAWMSLACYGLFGVPAFLLFALRNFFWKALQRITGAEQKELR